MMQLKDYQKRALKILEGFLAAANGGNEAAFKEFQSAQNYDSKYKPLEGLESVPYVCLRLPTGGGKTLMGTHAIKAVAENFKWQEEKTIDREFPFVLWLVPTDAIRNQTLKVLRSAESYYNQFLYENFHGSVKIFDVTDFRSLRPQDLRHTLNICVATFQSLRVKDKDGRKVYQADEEISACFTQIPRQEYFSVDTKGRYTSFSNLLSYVRPLVIVDEAHNNSTSLSFEILKVLRPSVIIELTATPTKNSNVLVKITAQELLKEAMIKLPIRIGSNELSPYKILERAIKKRAELEELSLHESKYIRPITLYQAENKNGEFNVDFIKKYLVEEAKIPADEIAIATGETRELDRKNLFSADCKIRHVITVQALKEGWDCPFASVFCSLAKVHSPKDAEQFLGRILRMPYAEFRTAPELNKAYVFFPVTSWEDAITKIEDCLFEMGFDKEEVKTALSEQRKLFEDNAAVLEKNSSSDEKKSPSERHEDFSIPQLCLDFGGKKEVATHENFFPADNWSITEATTDYSLPLYKDTDKQIFEIGLKENRLTKKMFTDNEEIFLEGFREWTLSQLIGWLARKIHDRFLTLEDFAEFTRRVLEQLMNEKNFSLDELAKERFEIKKLLAEKIEDMKAAACKKNFHTVLFNGESPKISVDDDFKFSFSPSIYPARNFYQGSVQFSKHFYPTVGDMNKEEVFCAQCIDANPNVATWIRNIEREPEYSFWLPTHKGKFYPDFVLKLADGTFAVVEYKGEVYVTTDDSKEKDLLGNLWADNSHGACKFLMAVKRDENGRSLSKQLKEFLSAEVGVGVMVVN